MIDEQELEELDFDDTIETAYEVWAIGYDLHNKPTEYDYLLDSFKDPDSAVTFADSVTVSEIREVVGLPLVRAEYFSIEVETTSVIDGEPTNIGTIYKRTIYYNSITADARLMSGDYELLDDGSIKIPKRLLSNFKEQDTITVMFAEEKEQPILTFKIIAEMDTYNYICDIVF